jgi:FlaA1/EpsC-like NDP-sugar epimerase
VLVDRAESALYMVQLELEARLQHARDGNASWGHTEVHVRLANVASRDSMRRLFQQERPDVVLHAAAYKHVPMLEDNPSEAVQVNIGGTLSILDAAMEAGPCRFILVSSDKAVWPSSVMGASKRVAEMLVTDAATHSGLAFASVRFGNVLGSNGSVLPIFQGQLEKGEPLTVTDPEMTRYFMTIPEAAWLILDATALATPGDLFALDMGRPVRIMDLARDLIRLPGRDPDAVPIRIIGLRKGEKIHEELFYDQERVEATASPKVLRTQAAAAPADVREVVARLLAMADGLHDAEVSESLHQFVRESVVLEEEMWRRRRVAVEISDQGGGMQALPGRLGGQHAASRQT